MPTKKNKPLPFIISKVETVQYAILTEMIDEHNLSFSVEFGFGIDTEQKTVQSIIKYIFKSNAETVLVLETAIYFSIEPTAFDKTVKPKKNYTLSKDQAIHFAMINVGTARGILHEKTNGTILNKFPMPTINIQEGITEDVNFIESED